MTRRLGSAELIPGKLTWPLENGDLKKSSKGHHGNLFWAGSPHQLGPASGPIPPPLYPAAHSSTEPALTQMDIDHLMLGVMAKYQGPPLIQPMGNRVGWGPCRLSIKAMRNEPQKQIKCSYGLRAVSASPAG